MDNIESNSADRIKAYISEIKFNNGSSLKIEANDIVLFVGPNNAGKTQALNDIYSKARANYTTLVISDITKAIKSGGSLQPLLEKIAVATNRVANNIYYHGHEINYNYNPVSDDENFCKHKYYSSFAPLFISRLTTENRLTVCKPPTRVNDNEPYIHPIHYAVSNYTYEKWLSESFHKAFGNALLVNTEFGKDIPLCIGPAINIPGGDAREQISRYAKTVNKYPQVQDQGDGIKSFTGILLYLMLDHYCTYLIDEPESFLHPPQARIMGQIIGHTLRDYQQAFISTHSEDILKGLLDECPERLKIVRITRTDNVNTFSILSNEKIKEVLDDPLLKYSNILSSLFHKTTVLCESDSDCKFYSIIDNHLKQKENKYSETLFVHCGGKDRIKKTAEALKALNVDIRIITDIDVLNNEDTIKGIASVLGADWNIIKDKYKILKSNINNIDNRISRESAKRDILEVLESSSDSKLSKLEIEKIIHCVRIDSKWKQIKEGGESSIPKGDAQGAFNDINKTLREHKIHIVPVGELEGFVGDVGGHGPHWVNEVLEKYPNPDDEVYRKAREFVKGIGL